MQILTHADKEALFALSFNLATLEALYRREPVKHSRRARKLADAITRTNALIELYPGQITGDALHLAATIFDELERKIMEGLGHGG